jgi:hypothetical protein
MVGPADLTLEEQSHEEDDIRACDSHHFGNWHPERPDHGRCPLLWLRGRCRRCGRRYRQRAIIGGAIANSQPGYYGPAQAMSCIKITVRLSDRLPGGYWARRPLRDAYGNFVGWSRPRFICP